MSLYDFENREGLFPAVDSRMKFALLTLGDGVDATDFVFFATATQQLSDSRRHFTLTSDDIALINPNTRTCPVFRNQMDAELTKKIYSHVPVLIDEALGEQGNPWGIQFLRMFDMANDSHHFIDRSKASDLGAMPDGPDWKLPNGKRYIRLYEGKMFAPGNHRSADVVKSDAAAILQNQPRYLTLQELSSTERLAYPLYWVDEEEASQRCKALQQGWLIGTAKVTSPTNQRTYLASALPRVAAGDSVLIVSSDYAYANQGFSAALLGCMNCLVFDYVARQKLGGLNMAYFVQKQLPMLPPGSFDSNAIEFIGERIKKIYATASDMVEFSKSVDGCPKIFPYDMNLIAKIQAELDAFYANLYGLNREEVRYILDPIDVVGPDCPTETFRVLKNNEIREFGEYRTQRLVLEAWDRLFGS